MMEHAAAAARKMSDADLIRVARALEAEVTAAMIAGVRGTHAHLGSIELATACTDELVARGYERGAKRDGSDLPVDVSTETVLGDPATTIKLSFQIRVF